MRRTSLALVAVAAFTCTGCWINFQREVRVWEGAYASAAFNRAGTTAVVVVQVRKRTEKAIVLLPNVDSNVWNREIWGEVREIDLDTGKTRALPIPRAGHARILCSSPEEDAFALVYLTGPGSHGPDPIWYRFGSGEEHPAPQDGATRTVTFRGEQFVFQRVEPEGEPWYAHWQGDWVQIAPPSDAGRVLKEDTVSVQRRGRSMGVFPAVPDGALQRCVFMAGGDVWIGRIEEVSCHVSGGDGGGSMKRQFHVKNPKLLVDLQNGQNER